jgi:hypothetical protein
MFYYLYLCVQSDLLESEKLKIQLGVHGFYKTASNFSRSSPGSVSE